MIITLETKELYLSRYKIFSESGNYRRSIYPEIPDNSLGWQKLSGNALQLRCNYFGGIIVCRTHSTMALISARGVNY
jgi:hypothetical protein